MLGLINGDRLNPANEAETQGRAPALRWNTKLAAVARAHSEDMLRRGFFAHINPEGKSPGQRVEAAGIPWQAEGENIAIYRSVAWAQRAFMNEPHFEPNHRTNILNHKYTEVGVGIVRGPDGMYYITQEFIETPAGSSPAEAGASQNAEALPAALSLSNTSANVMLPTYRWARRRRDWRTP